MWHIFCFCENTFDRNSHWLYLQFRPLLKKSFSFNLFVFNASSTILWVFVFFSKVKWYTTFPFNVTITKHQGRPLIISLISQFVCAMNICALLFISNIGLRNYNIVIYQLLALPLICTRTEVRVTGDGWGWRVTGDGRCCGHCKWPHQCHSILGAVAVAVELPAPSILQQMRSWPTHLSCSFSFQRWAASHK